MKKFNSDLYGLNFYFSRVFGFVSIHNLFVIKQKTRSFYKGTPLGFFITILDFLRI